jgi:hypothetical protein
VPVRAMSRDIECQRVAATETRRNTAFTRAINSRGLNGLPI